jgi:hypothetical protein
MELMREPDEREAKMQLNKQSEMFATPTAINPVKASFENSMVANTAS